VGLSVEALLPPIVGLRGDQPRAIHDGSSHPSETTGLIRFVHLTVVRVPATAELKQRATELGISEIIIGSKQTTLVFLRAHSIASLVSAGPRAVRSLRRVLVEL